MEAAHRQELERLYLQMYIMLFEYARSSLSSDALAEEAVQDTFHIACQKPEAVLRSPNPEGWMVKTLKNVVSNTMRSQAIARRILAEYTADNAGDITAVNDRIRFELNYEDVADLEEFRLVKSMVLDGKSYQELSQELGITVAACRKRMQRAKEILRKKIRL